MLEYINLFCILSLEIISLFFLWRNVALMFVTFQDFIVDGTQLSCDDFLQNYNILVDIIDWYDSIVVTLN